MASLALGPLASSGRGSGAGELSGLGAGWRATLRIADGDKSLAVHPGTTGAWIVACSSCSCRSGAGWVHGDRRSAAQGTAATVAAGDINGTDLDSAATAASSRTASISWIMERFAGSASWRYNLPVVLGCWRWPSFGSPSAVGGARSAAAAGRSCR